MRRTLSIRWLLLAANALILLLPLAAILGLRLYDVALLRQTERQLISESVLVGEAFRDAYVQAGGATGSHRRPWQRDARYTPVEPVIDVGTPLLAPSLQPRRGASTDALAITAGASIEPLMQRAQTFNLSGVRVLDATGCVIATTGGQRGECLESAPEVHDALKGNYAASTRERISDEPPPPFGDIRRRGGIRVFTALPIWHGERVIGVVAASRTGLDALSSLWQNRRDMVLVAAAALTLVVLAALFLAWAIARPLRRLTESARGLVAGGTLSPSLSSGFVPSEVAVLTEALRQMTERLQARAEHAAEQTARVSHELKTPLSAIRGAVELLRDVDTDMPMAQRERFIANIDADAERMERLVTGLLTLARIESEATKATDPLSVEDAVRSWVARYEDVKLEVRGSLGKVAIREEHLASVVLNLVDNARRHGAGKPVKVELSREGKRLRIVVTDQGPGISEANQSRIFDRFFTTERDQGGTGLGLSIVKAITDARGGSVTCTSNESGTTFAVLL